ncbi:SLAM family member 6 isoform X7 [Trachypithecus francoisi]|uniref:SLAM family member 6 isoform X7 n=1 Tax=Trachypithecus francoisi TaxID=54180 RepID=UPI00141ACD61|nr:SLAM family member 6 isoform X7 [Trachypithecus francoisi]
MTEKQNVDCLKVSSTSLTTESMLWLFQSLLFVFCFGPAVRTLFCKAAAVCWGSTPDPIHLGPSPSWRCHQWRLQNSKDGCLLLPLGASSKRGTKLMTVGVLLYKVSGNLVSQSRSTPLMVNGVLGESVILPLEFPAGERIQSITWLYNGTSLAFIVLSETNSPKIHMTHPKQQKRLNFTQSYSLKLSNLEMEDTGSYSAQITTETSAKLSSYTLRIFRQLRNIQVNNYSQLFQNRTCEIHLTCSVEDADDNVSFRWEALGSTLSSEPNITTSWDPRISSEQDYTCIAENAVSNLSFSVSAQKLCGDSLPLSTQRTQGPAESAGNIEYVSVSPVNNTVYASVTHSNRETEISTPIKNATVTIYSTINHSKESKPTFSRATALDNVM